MLRNILIIAASVCGSSAVQQALRNLLSQPRESGMQRGVAAILQLHQRHVRQLHPHTQRAHARPVLAQIHDRSHHLVVVTEQEPHVVQHDQAVLNLLLWCHGKLGQHALRHTLPDGLSLHVQGHLANPVQVVMLSVARLNRGTRAQLIFSSEKGEHHIPLQAVVGVDVVHVVASLAAGRVEHAHGGRVCESCVRCDAMCVVCDC